MQRPIPVPLLTSVVLLVGFVASAEADVTLELRLPSSSVVAGLSIPVDIYAVANGETVGKVQAVLQWDPAKLSLESNQSVPPSPTNPWQTWGFGGGGLNSDYSDGNALFAAAAVPCQTLQATSGGTRVATIYFTALEPTTPTTTDIEILPSLTQDSVTYNTEVWDKLGPIFCGGVPYSTVPLGPPVSITIFACINDANCVDGNACTDDACSAGVCTFTNNFDEGVECCNPGPSANAHGTPAGGVEIIDDDNSCTNDSCNSTNGYVTHTPRGSGTACDPELNTTCAPTHTCDGAGTCQPHYAQAGSFCDDQDECSQDSACDGAGNCVGSNFLPNGTTCSDGDDCTVGETCLDGDCQGGASPCTSPRFCNPDAYANTGLDCPCPPDQVCHDFGGTTGQKCAHPYRCDECHAGLGQVECSSDGDCLLPECVAGSCIDDRLPSDAVCQDGSYCNGHEYCNAQNGACQPPVNPDPCSGTPSTPICNEADDECVECLSSADCDSDPCLIEVCNTTLKECEPDPPPVDCSYLNEDCLVGSCQPVGGCTPYPVELVECDVPADCSPYEPTRYSCIGGFCATVNCDDGEDCTSSDRCQSGVCAGDPPVSDGPIDLVWVPASQSLDVNDPFSLDLYASKNSGPDQTLDFVEVLITWNPDLVTLTGNMDPCTAEPCPAGQYDWSGAGSYFPIGGFDTDGINTACGGANPPCPDGRACINGRCNDGDAFLIAQRRLGDVGATVTTANPLWVTTIEFQGDSPTGLAGTDIDVVSCIAATVTRVIAVGGAFVTGNLGSSNVVLGCLVNGDCDDGNACTDDVCQGNSTCLSTPNYTVGIECCDPVNGSTIPIDDGNDCTDDSCNSTDGIVTHTPRPAGTSCGSPANTDCDNPDSCDETGNCLENHESDGVSCAADANDCTDDVCGSGACTHPNKASGAACGDQSTNTTCDGLDSCDGFGVCLDNLASPMTPCGSPDDTECTDPDMCDGAGSCDPKHAATGTSCGSASDTDCDNPDSCDGSGSCLPNAEPMGTNCEDGVFCNGQDSCDGTGVCLHAGPPCSTCECVTAVNCSVGACVPCVDCIDDSSDICESETQCPCDAPVVVTAGARYLGVTPQPVESGQTMKIRVTSPEFPCLSKYVSGPKRCGGTGALCVSQADCNQCSVSGDSCLGDEDCSLPGEICVISGLQCVTSSVTPFDINGDGSPDGMLATLADDPGDAAELTPAEWGAALTKCSLSYGDCTVDEDCDHGTCQHAGCGSQVCDTPCSVSAQNCSKFCDNPAGIGCTSSDDCAPGGTCIEPTCERDETCIPGRVYIVGPDIVPSDAATPRSYSVRVDCGGETAPVAVQMRRWCDVNGDGAMNFTDIQMDIFAFQGIYGRGNGIPNMLAGCDFVGQTPCFPNQVVNFTDIAAQVFAFQSETYVGRLAAGTCANAMKCSVTAQNCTDGSTCTRTHDCELPCAP